MTDDDDDESGKECGYDKRTCVSTSTSTAVTTSLMITMIIFTIFDDNIFHVG